MDEIEKTEEMKWNLVGRDAKKRVFGLESFREGVVDVKPSGSGLK